MKGESTRKRTRETATDSKSKDSSSSQEPSPKKPPAYGKQDYWEQRYNQNLNDESDSKQKALPETFHSWYFSYEELSPILLPIILGDIADDESDNDNNEFVQEDEAEQEESPNHKNTTEVGKEDGENDSDENGDQDEHIEENGDAEEEDEDEDFVEFEEIEDDDSGDQAARRMGLAKDGAISVLEVGCGDVPLGRDLARGIASLESAIGVAASNILKQVVCIDYAKSVIDIMKKEQEKESSDSVSVLYEVGDARKLVYPDSSFELILEKGTMDAMLSDITEGAENCRLIVAECARLLTVGGCLLIVSHLNAHIQAGLEWLDSIVVPGLRKGGKNNSWEIEVHGNAADIPPLEDGNEDEQNSPGPAVYVICKGETMPSQTKSSKPLSGKDLATIPLRFFSY